MLGLASRAALIKGSNNFCKEGIVRILSSGSGGVTCTVKSNHQEDAITTGYSVSRSDTIWNPASYTETRSYSNILDHPAYYDEKSHILGHPHNNFSFQDAENLISYKTYLIPVQSSMRNNLYFPTSQVNCKSGGEADPPEDKKPDLDKVAVELSYELIGTFVRNQNWTIYHRNLIFEDRIRGKRIEGLREYIKFIILMKVVANIRFVYLRFHILKLTKHPEDSTIRVRWRIAAIGVTRLVLRFFPDKMWRRGNLDKCAPSWYDGYSVFHIGSDNLIFKHVADTRMPDQDKEKATLNSVVEKLKKLKPATTPAPAL